MRYELFSFGGLSIDTDTNKLLCEKCNSKVVKLIFKTIYGNEICWLACSDKPCNYVKEYYIKTLGNKKFL